MARIVSTALLVCAVFVFGLPENGRTAELDIKQIAKGYRITCKTVGPESVDVIQITKEDNAVSKMIANIAKNRKHVVVSDDFKEKFQYYGYIVESGGSLSLVIADPTTQEEGQYRCDVYYSGKPMHTVSSGFLRLEDRQTQKKLADLKSQMVTLKLKYDKDVGSQGKQLRELQKIIGDLRTETSTLTSQMTSQKNTCDQMVAKQETDLQGLQKKIKDLKSQMTSQSKTYGENLKQQEESFQNKIKDLKSQMTSQKTTCDQMVTKQGTDLQGLQKKITDLKSQMTSQNTTYGENLKKQEESLQTKIKDLTSQMVTEKTTFQDEISKLNSQIALQKTTCNGIISTHGQDFTNLRAKVTGLISGCEKQVKDQEKAYRELKKKMDDLNGEYKYQFESIGRKRYVSMHVLNMEIEKVTKSIDGKVSSETRILNNTILQTQHDFEEKLNQLNGSLGMGLGLSMDKLSNITKEFAKKDDLDAVQDRVDSVEDLLEAESEQISLLRDKVSVNEFVITSLSNKPGSPTKSPGKDPVVEVIEKVSALEQNSRNQTQQIKFLLDKDTMAANEIDDLANVTFHLNQTLNRLAQKAAVQETGMTAFCAKNSKKIDAAIKDVIVFDDVSLNKGGAYDKTTGSFTAPRAGIYGFNLVIMTRMKMEFIDIDLQVKNRKDQLVTLSSHETEQEEQNSVSVVTELKAGEVVQAIVRSTYGNPPPTEIIEFYFSVFSGYFIQPV